MLAIVVHGGAGGTSLQAEKGCRRAAQVGMRMLAKGGDALDAAIKAVVRMENSALYNAGSGSVIRRVTDGTAIIQMDAVVATSDGFYAAVGAVEGVRNPVVLARLVGTRTDHRFVVGPGATELAQKYRLGRHPGPSQMAWERYRHLKETGEDVRPSDPEKKNCHEVAADTVGAIAFASGKFGIAASTGGMGDMVLGRIGDVPFPGDGFQVGRFCAVLSTGLGEKIMDVHGADQVYKRIVEMGVRPQQACEEGVARFEQDVAVGFIALAIVNGRLEAGSYSNRGMPFYPIIGEQ